MKTLSSVVLISIPVYCNTQDAIPKMEFRLGLDYLANKTKITGTDSTTTTSGFAPLYTRFKIKIREEQRCVPSIAFSGALVLPFTACESYGVIPEKGKQEHLANAGIGWPVKPNLQPDVSGGKGLNKAAADNFISFGISYHLPR
jgi:hypothetical protein